MLELSSERNLSSSWDELAQEADGLCHFEASYPGPTLFRSGYCGPEDGFAANPDPLAYVVGLPILLEHWHLT